MRIDADNRPAVSINSRQHIGYFIILLARVLAMVRCLCVSVCHNSELYQTGWTDQGVFFGTEASFDLSYTVLQGISHFRYLQKLS